MQNSGLGRCALDIGGRLREKGDNKQKAGGRRPLESTSAELSAYGHVADTILMAVSLM